MLEIIAVVNAIRARSVIKDGREYLVAPATLLVSGVLNGSQGPLYYPSEEVEANPSDWDGMPIVVYHPISSDGRPISANSQEVLDSQGIGFVADPQAKAGQLKAKLWFDVEATERVDNRVLLSLRRDERIELSTGLSVERQPAEYGATDSKGRTYNSVARNYIPDHLAILPDEIGACSLRDGCGVLVNCEACLCPGAREEMGWEEVGLASTSSWPTLSPYVSNSSSEQPELISNPMGKWQPPNAGDAPKEVKDILRKVYTAYRNKHPQEVASVKARGAKIAWTAVRKAGWTKDTDGQWHKTENVDNAQTKTEGGTSLSASAYAYVPDPESPSTWKLRIDDAKHVAAAVAAIGKGFRGQKVDIPAVEMSKVKSRIRSAWKKFNPSKKESDMPEILNSEWSEIQDISNATSDMALEEIEHAVRRAFRAANPVKYDPDTGSAIDPCMVVSVFPDYLIYMENWDDLYRQSYTMDADGRVTLENDVESVRRVTAYVPIESANLSPGD